MYYFGFFRNLDFSNDEKGQLFKVVIITDYQNKNFGIGEELTFTDSPFTIEYSTDENDLFKPYKCSTATIGLLQKDMNFDFHTTSGNDVLVKLLKFNNEDTEDDLSLMASDDEHFTIEWIGFATPNAYSQGYENYFDEFELECQDAISTLQYYKYEILGETPSFVSFSDIVKKWCVFLGTYNNIYITDTIVIPTTDFEDVLHTCYVDERNFFDEDGKPMTVLSVLEEICKYLSITCVPFKDNLYFISYSAIKNGYNNYYVIKDTPLYDSEIEYLQSTGTQYINLPLSATTGTELSIEGEIIPKYSNNYTYSIFSSNPYQQFEAKFYSRNTTTNRITYESTIGTVVTNGGWGGIQDVKNDFLLSTKGKYSNGVYTELSRPLTANITAFRLFGGYRNNNRYPVAFGKLKIKKNGTVVFDLVPVRVGNVGYMFDKVNKTLIGNIGSGNFTLGDDIGRERNYILQQSLVTLEHVHDILPNDFASNGTNITLLPTYNKVSVKDDFYPFDSIVPNIEDSDNIVETEILDTVGYSPEYTSEVVAASNELTRINVQLGGKRHVVFIKYNGYENSDSDAKKLYTYWWDIVSGGVTPNYTIIEDRNYNYQTTCTHIGALPIQYQISEVGFFDENINLISLKEGIMITSPIGNVGDIGDTYNKVLEWRSDNIALGRENYIVISGNFNFFIVSAHLPFKMEDFDYYMDDEFSYQWASLRCGEYWWDGYGWVYQPARVIKFKLPIKYEYGKKAYGESIPIANNIDYTMRLHKQGYAVPTPYFEDNGVEIKNISFVLYNPNRIDDDSDNHFDPSVVLLTDFNIEIATKNQLQLIETKNDSNTEYTNEISNGAVEEKEEIECKLTTFDLKSTNYSSLLYSENFYENGYENALSNTFRRLRTIYNKGIGDIALAEELIVNNNVRQYSTPTAQLEVNLHNDIDFKPYSLLNYHFFEGKDFVVDGMSINVKDNNNTLKIVEKK